MHDHPKLSHSDATKEATDHRAVLRISRKKATTGKSPDIRSFIPLELEMKTEQSLQRPKRNGSEPGKLLER